MQRLPYLEWSSQLPVHWWTVLRASDVLVVTDEPLLDRWEAAAANGLRIPKPSVEEMESLTALVCTKGKAEVSVAGSMHPELKRYLIYFNWGSGWFGRGRQNAALATEIFNLLKNAGAIEFDPWRN